MSGVSQFIPPPPTMQKSRNQSLAASMTSYRARPTVSRESTGNEGFSFRDVRAALNIASKPEVRNAVGAAARNPVIRSGVSSIVQNEKVRSAVAQSLLKNMPRSREEMLKTSAESSSDSFVQSTPPPPPRYSSRTFAVNNDITRSVPQKTVVQPSYNPSWTLSSANCSQPINQKNTPNNSCRASWSANTSTNPHFSTYDIPPLLPNTYPTSAPQNSFTSPSLPRWETAVESKWNQSPTVNSASSDCQSLDPFSDVLQTALSGGTQTSMDRLRRRSESMCNLPEQSTNFEHSLKLNNQPSLFGASLSPTKKKQPPPRPPPPKLSKAFVNALNASKTPTTEPYAIVRYPFNAANLDELSCRPNDTVILQKEVNNEWIHGLNTRTGNSGIVPITFLDVKIPLAPTIRSTSRTDSDDFRQNEFNVIATYDFRSGVSGDLNFSAGDRIKVIEKVDANWLRGTCRGAVGIFPINFVKSESENSNNALRTSNSLLTLSNNSTMSGFRSNGCAKTVKAIFDYNSGVAGDLAFRSGDVITVVEKINNDWIRGKLGSAVGLVPITFVSRT
ncbi:hypothetical protein AB6A40_006770 [Gnathostoma spinigerum]|uniref:SH3 domain-containing protein n=1 Tax=Gnathostoma spinigerum TaxID=75299 RepID=A0ABD6EJX4_9BILA